LIVQAILVWQRDKILEKISHMTLPEPQQ
jgi:hypothetical protein